MNNYQRIYFLVYLVIYIEKQFSLAEDANHEGSSIPCYDEEKKAQRCIPQFENAAFGLEAEATNTCGQNGPIEYCDITRGYEEACQWCNSSSQFSTFYMTDSLSDTWWQSETMFEGIQAPNHVNLTFHFGKTFDITSIHLTFKSSRPHSFAIYKKTSEDGPWIPYHYYSADCQTIYGIQAGNSVEEGEKETKAFCTSEYSDLSPLTGGSVYFATVEGRPSAINFERSPEFLEWVTASDIRITLNRLNTFNDEIYRHPLVLKSYFYAISSISVGARCKCNGHADKCWKISNGNTTYRTCQCMHNTAGPDCNECQPGYNDAPWRRATETDPFVCQACNCNGFSERCYFDKALYQMTGHGGHCLECSSNRDGPNCERCRPNYYLPLGDTACHPCNCNEIGSKNLQCNSESKCFCKYGVTGDKCDRCDSNFYDFGINGCKECGCKAAGSLLNEASCNPYTGVCQCKEFVEGRQCSSCKPGYFNLEESNEFGCTPCFCYGHSSVCHSAPGYSQVMLESGFVRGSEKWKAETVDGRRANLMYNTFSQGLEVVAQSADPLYFVASERFLGDQRASYNHDLSFKLRINDNSVAPSFNDIILEGAGLSIRQAIFGQNNSLPSTTVQKYKFRLNENPKYGWQPRVSSKDFISILANLTAFKIRGTYTPLGNGFLDEVVLETARRDAAGVPATWVEMCTCPEGYIGQYCESCMPGFRHEPVSAEAFAPCVPCNCNNHARICDADTGKCICEHNTAGDNCERCARGYYGNALGGTALDCKQCPCPGQGACMLIGDDDTIFCSECPRGYGGPLCETCSDGFYGDPKGVFGSVRECQPCDCNSNVDLNAIGNCNSTTGECLKCIYNTGGFLCDQCLPGYYGDALSPGKADCKRCMCYSPGTLEFEGGVLNCDQVSGQCKCKSHVVGTNCDECEPGYFDIDSQQGCQSCGCSPVGSINGTCDVVTGQCYCRPGVTGLHCDVCLPHYYGFSLDGCKPCDCDRIGSMSSQCDNNGQCPCLENIEGRKCDRCKENKFDKQQGCVNCPPCYNLVQDAVNMHRNKLQSLEQSIKNISNSDLVSFDADFEEKLKSVRKKVEKLAEDVKGATALGNDGKITNNKLVELHKKLDDIKNASDDVANLTIVAKNVVMEAEENVTVAEQIIEQAGRTLNNAYDYLNIEGKSALAKAIDKSAQVGEQNAQMSQIARDARALVQKQEEEADKFKLLADEALNISQEAYNKAVDTLTKQKSISEGLKNLSSDLVFTGERLNSTIDTAKAVQEQVDLAYIESVSILRDVRAIAVPIINIAEIKDSSLYYLKFANENQANAEKLLSDNKNLLIELDNKIRSAENLLHLGVEQEQTAEELLADVDAAYHKAEEAVKLGNKTLQEAQKTYDILQEFNNGVQQSREKAKEAVLKIPDIAKLNKEIEEKTKSVEKTVFGAENDAVMAKQAAEEAQKIAQKASEEAFSIKKQAEATLNEENNLVSKIDEVKNSISETSGKINGFKQKAEVDHSTISQAKEKVGQAKANAAEVKKQVEKAEQDINTLLNELNNLPEIDDQTLSKLAEKLETVEKQFEEHKIDEELNKFKTTKYDMFERVKKYKDELNHLQKDVTDLEKIRASLPANCFKRPRLEI